MDADGRRSRIQYPAYLGNPVKIRLCVSATPRLCGKILIVNKDLDLWQYVSECLVQNQEVMLLVVAESKGSSPGRQGYKMAVGADGELVGSIGGGVMEISLVEQCRAVLSEPRVLATGFPATAIKEQVHQKSSPNASGMICSGKQTVIFKQITTNDLQAVEAIIVALKHRRRDFLLITSSEFKVTLKDVKNAGTDYSFQKISDTDFIYQEKIGKKNDLYIIGCGHCALALSELMARMDFHICMFDDRPALNTIEKNKFADEITMIDRYETIAARIPNGDNIYVVVMTLGYTSDEIAIRQLIAHDLRYFGVLGSRAKMKTLFMALENDGFAKEKLARISTPIGLPINSRTPEEIAVSIAAEIIAMKNKAFAK